MISGPHGKRLCFDKGIPRDRWLFLYIHVVQSCKTTSVEGQSLCMKKWKVFKQGWINRNKSELPQILKSWKFKQKWLTKLYRTNWNDLSSLLTWDFQPRTIFSGPGASNWNMVIIFISNVRCNYLPAADVHTMLACYNCFSG